MKKLLGWIVAVLALAGSTGFAESAGSVGKTITVAWLSISNDNAYFISCRQGAEKAAKELGVNLISDGPAHPDPARQIEIVDHWASLGVDAIAAACDSRDGLSPALRRAREKGIKVITFDADAQADARAFFVNQATAESIGTALMDDANQLCGPEGQYAIITANLTSANENEWLKYIDARNQSSCPGLKRVALRACGDNIEKARVETAALLRAYPDLKLVMAICSPGVPGAAQAVVEAGKTGQVKVIGLGLPNENKEYVHEGVTNNIILWKTLDLGELTLRAAVALVKGTLQPGDKTFAAGTLGHFEIHGDEIWLGKPFTFDKENIDQFDF